MNLVKTFLVVGVSAAAGSWVGGKAYAAVADKLPASAQGDMTRTGFQAGFAVLSFGVLRSVF